MIMFSLALLGLCFGSFVSALVWRLDQQFAQRPKNKNKDLSILRGRSMCPNCRHQLAPKDLVPVFSWLSLGGKCRYCRQPIEDGPWTEIVTAALFVISYAAWPRPLTGLATASLALWLALVVAGVALAVYDLRHRLLPNKLVAAAGMIVGAQVVFMTFNNGPAYLLEALIGALSFGGLFYVLFQVSDGKWIGGGDVKLGLVLGAWLADYRLSLLTIFVASAIGTLVVVLLAFKKRATWGSKLPFGPLLLIGTFMVVLYGQRLIDWYLNQLLAV